MENNKQRDNVLQLFLDTRLLVAVSGLASQKKQGNKTYILNLINEACKNELPPEAYEELKAKYSLTVYDQKSLKAEKLKKKMAKDERKLKALESNAEAYKKQTQQVLNKDTEQKIRELKVQRARLKQGYELRESEFGHTRELIEQIDKELAILEAQINSQS